MTDREKKKIKPPAPVAKELVGLCEDLERGVGLTRDNVTWFAGMDYLHTASMQEGLARGYEKAIQLIRERFDLPKDNGVAG